MSPISQPRLTISVRETADLLGISRWLAYEQIERGELPVLRIGRRLRVPVRPLLALVGMSWEDWLMGSTREPSALSERKPEADGRNGWVR
jgi:excisionase family DNA binding protein